MKTILSCFWIFAVIMASAEPQKFCPLMVTGEVDGAEIVAYKGSKIELFCGSCLKNLKFKGNEFS